MGRGASDHQIFGRSVDPILSRGAASAHSLLLAPPLPQYIKNHMKSTSLFKKRVAKQNLFYKLNEENNVLRIKMYNIKYS